MSRDHDGGSSITQPSIKPTRDNPGRPSNPYKSGANVHKGGGGSQGKGGTADAAGPKSGRTGT